MIRYDNPAFRDEQRIPIAEVLAKTEGRSAAIRPQPTDAAFHEMALMRMEDDGCPWTNS
jgi:hypothetical protein